MTFSIYDCFISGPQKRKNTWNTFFVKQIFLSSNVHNVFYRRCLRLKTYDCSNFCTDYKLVFDRVTKTRWNLHKNFQIFVIIESV